MSTSLHTVDLAILAGYACGMIALGWYYGRKQGSVSEYFVGSGGMPPLLIGISLFATLLSTITYLSTPGEIIRHGPVFLTGLLSVPIAYVIVGYGLIPVLMRQRVTSAYELLEAKLGLGARLSGASMFIALRLMWMAVLLNFAANAMLVMLDWDGSRLLPVTVVVGTVALVYSVLGGLRAVVITDLIQFLLLFGGALMVVLTVTLRLGGLEWFPTSWDSGWDTQPLFSFDPYVRLTVVGVVVMQTLWAVCTAGGDQTAVQRYMATRDARAARQSYLTNAGAVILVVSTLSLVGVALLGYFRAYPDQLPDSGTVAEAADGLFPHYIAYHLPVGVSGLVMAGMFSAAMSSVDSGVNSISAVVTTDFVDRFRSHPVTERQHVRLARGLALLVGVVVIAASILIEYVPGNFLEVSKRVTGLLVTPIFTLFFLALFVPFATSAGAVVGALGGFLTAILVAFWDPLIESQPISFTWINPCALTAGLVVGCCASLLHRRWQRMAEKLRVES